METLQPVELSGDFDIGYLNKKGFSGYGMHRHKYCELLFVIDGDLRFLAEDNIYHHRGSCLIFFRENRLHTTEIDPNVNYERYNLYFKYKYIGELVPFGLIREVYDNDCIVIPLDAKEKEDMLFYFREMYKQHAVGSEIADAVTVHLLCAVLLKTALFVKDNRTPDVCHVDSYISGVVKYISDNIVEKLVIADIAEAFFVSRAKLINDFKKETGVTIGEYIASRRTKLAKKNLKLGMKVSEVAVRSGFGNTCHFIRTFKKQTGYTPLQYKNKNGDK